MKHTILSKRRGSQNYTTIIAIILVLVIGGGLYYILQNPAEVPEGDITDTTGTGGDTPDETQSEIPDFEILLTGTEGDSVTLGPSDFDELTKIEMDGGLLTSAGSIKGPYKYTGVPLSEVLALVGEITNDNSLRVTAADGYAMVFTWEELNGDFLTFSSATGDEVEATEELIPVLSYLQDDEPLSEGHGPIRLVILGEEGLISEGHFWIKQVVEIEVIAAIREYTLDLSGELNETMDRATFESGVNCPDTTPDHQGVYVDGYGGIWTGIPLWLLVGRIDDTVTHTGNAYSRDLADAGAYTIQVIAEDGYTVELNSSFVKLNENILLANELDGSALPDKYWPLRLVGDDLTSGQMIRNVAMVKLVFGEDAGENETENPTEIPKSVDVPVFTITLSGGMTEVMTKDFWMTAITCETLQHVYTWTDGNGDEWTGIPVWLLVGRVDDDNDHGPAAFNRELAASGYQVSFIASDGYHKELESTLIAENNEILVAYLLNGEALPEDKAPLRVVGEGLETGEMVSKLDRIELIFP